MSTRNDEMRHRVVAILAQIFERYPEARNFLIRECDFDEKSVPSQHAFDNGDFWERAYTLAKLGTTKDGLAGFAAAVLKRLPSNAVIQEFYDFAAGAPAAEEDDTPPPRVSEAGTVRRPSWRGQQPPAGPAGKFNVVEIFGSDDYTLIFQTVLAADPGYQVCYTAHEQFGAVVRDRTVADRIARDLRHHSEITVQFNVYDTRPYALFELRLIGPDRQEFALSAEPSTTLVEEIPAMVLEQYTDGGQRGSRIRTVVDLLEPAPGRGRRRLDPKHTLHEAGVVDGSTLQVSTEVIAGAPRNAERALARARNQIRDFARDQKEFILLDQRPRGLPREYEAELRVPGIERLEQGERHPTKRHQLTIHLPAEYPDTAPKVLWQTPIYHPNVGTRSVPGQREPLRILCLGFLEKHYEPNLDLGYLCQMILDVARCRNYSLPDELDPDTPGEFDTEALTWFMSEDGQRMIESIGGLSVADLIRYQYGDRDSRRRRTHRISRAGSEPR
ncbi:ubiquitin-conjugating enzyme E2 [Actinoplanes sp. NPDC004185]